MQTEHPPLLRGNAGRGRDSRARRRTSTAGRAIRLAACLLSLPFSLAAAPIISEFMAANPSTLADDDGAFSDWIEIHNPDSTAASLDGWYLTDTATNRTKWQFPAVSVPPGGYLLVWASSKDRRDPARVLHTNFALSSGGEYLGLVRPDGQTVASEFAPTYPPQRDNVSYGVSQVPGEAATIGFFVGPTPGRRNGATSHGLAETVAFSRAPGPFRGSFLLQLTGASPDQRIRYVLAAPSLAGFSVAGPTATSPEYTQPLTITQSAVVRAAVFSPDDGASGAVATAHFPLLDGRSAAFTSELPILVLDDHGFGPLRKDGIDHPSWLYAFSPDATGTARLAADATVATPLTLTVRGQSSAEFPKKSYNLKFTDPAGARRAQALFGSAAYEKWALVAPWSYDRTFISNALAYALSNRIGRWAPRTQLTEVYFNTGAALDPSAYHGVCVLTDRIELGPGRVELTPLSAGDVAGSAVTGGYIVKLDNRDDDEYGFRTTHGIPEVADSLVVVAYPKNADMAPAQRTYIHDYVQAMEDALHADAAAGWAVRNHLDYLDRASWVDQHLLHTLAANPDAFRRSTYFTKDRDGRLVAGPLWDFDRAFNSSDLRNVGPEGWRAEPNAGGSLWEAGWLKVLGRDPEFRQEWIDRWQTLRRAELSDPSLLALIDALVARVRAAAVRDAARWPDNASRSGSYDAEIVQLKLWLLRRATWIDRQFVAAPAIEWTGPRLRLTPAAGTLLVYTLDGSDPRMLGGAVAPNAFVATSPVEVAADANLHARSYAGDPGASFPATAWSAPAIGEGSSPLRPAARLVNVSARNFIAPGQESVVAQIVVADTLQKRILARGVGPGLAEVCEAVTLPDCELVLSLSPNIEIARNRGWDAVDPNTALPQLFQSVGAFPLRPGSRDAAFTATLPSGTYLLAASSPSGASGLTLTELYEVDTRGRIAALTFRAPMRAEDGVLMAGFVVQGPAYKRMLLRAVLLDAAPARRDPASGPVLSLYRGSGAGDVADRSAGPSRARQSDPFFEARIAVAANGSDPAALLVTVPPGPYVATLRSPPDSGGIGYLEIREVP